MKGPRCPKDGLLVPYHVVLQVSGRIKKWEDRSDLSKGKKPFWPFSEHQSCFAAYPPKISAVHIKNKKVYYWPTQFVFLGIGQISCM